VTLTAFWNRVKIIGTQMAEKAPSIQHIIEELQAGSSKEENFRLLFESYYPQLYRFFAKSGRSPDDCLDLIQETFVGIYKGIGSFRGGARFETWLYKIAANAERKKWRWGSARKRAAREVPLESEAGENPQAGGRPLVSEAPGPDDEALHKERRRQLREAITRLPGQMQKCLLLRIDRGLTYQEIGILLRLTPGTVKAHLSEARRRLQEELSQDLGDSLARLDEEDPDAI
jgi:RNA polymerase sigma-70 factor, ECF subfamily